MRVKATREGLIGDRTASGYVIDEVVPFVALPSKRALHKFVRVYNPSSTKWCYAIVLDIGPWNIDDDEYVIAGARPQAECGTDKRGRVTNGAGIDLSQSVWKQLEMQDNTDVDWAFLNGAL